MFCITIGFFLLRAALLRGDHVIRFLKNKRVFSSRWAKEAIGRAEYLIEFIWFSFLDGFGHITPLGPV